MNPPRFRIRSLVLLIFVVGLILSVGLLTLENARLRQQMLAAERQNQMARAQALNAQMQAERLVRQALVDAAQRVRAAETKGQNSEEGAATK
jgi:hypothetical protein